MEPQPLIDSSYLDSLDAHVADAEAAGGPENPSQDELTVVFAAVMPGQSERLHMAGADAVPFRASAGLPPDFAGGRVQSFALEDVSSSASEGEQSPEPTVTSRGRNVCTSGVISSRLRWPPPQPAAASEASAVPPAPPRRPAPLDVPQTPANMTPDFMSPRSASSGGADQGEAEGSEDSGSRQRFAFPPTFRLRKRRA